MPKKSVTDPETGIAYDVIAVGDRVRSFDFPFMGELGQRSGFDLEGENAAYVEGVVTEITGPVEGCPRYRIQPTRRVFRGKEVPIAPDEEVLPPVNGTPTILGSICFGVVKIEDGPSD